MSRQVGKPIGAVPQVERVDEEPIEIHDVEIRREILDRHSVRRSRDEMRVDMGRPVWRDRDVKPGSHLRDPPPFGDATAHRDVRLKDLDRPIVEQLAEWPARRLQFACRDRDRGAPGELGEERNAIGQERLLDPPRVECLEAFGSAKRVADRRPGVVGIERQAAGRTQHFARKPHPLDIDRKGLAADLDLHRVKAARQVGRDFGFETFQVIVA